MGVRIRLKSLGRKHRPYFRIVAMDSRMSRDGKALEELGTYDPMIPETDNRVTLKAERVKHWLSVGALPTEKVGVLINKYLDKWTKIENEQTSQASAPAAEETSEAAPEESSEENS